MPKTKGETITVETDAVGMAELTILLRRLEQIDREAALISEKTRELMSVLPAPVNREARRTIKKAEKHGQRLRFWLEELKDERAMIVVRIQEIRAEGVKGDGIQGSLSN